MMAFLRKWPLHVVLLPIYFITSAYTQYAGLFESKESLLILLQVFLALTIGYALFYFVFRDKVKAGIAATVTGLVYLFFGNIKELLRHTDLLYFISHYKTLIPILLLLLGILFFRLKKGVGFSNLNLFLNVLLILYLGIEVWNFSRLSTKAKTAEGHNSLLAIPSNPATTPNIYYILLDCYPGSGYQKDMLNVAENDLDIYLKEKGFYVVDESRSNYNMTSFSIASLFNMDYLYWLDPVERVKPYDYNKTTHLVRNSAVFNGLLRMNYELCNLSIFDMPGSPSLNPEKFLSTTGREIILYNTFYKCLYRDVFPGLFPRVKHQMIDDAKANRKARLQIFSSYNRQIMDSLYRIPMQNSSKPRFVYAHLEMPHFPYFYDSLGRAYPEDQVFGRDMIRSKERFKNYVGYTNRQATNLLDSIFSINKGQDIIIIQSDHGLNDLDHSRKNDAFRNYTAFYFPDRKYQGLKSGLSNVNTFRIIFNKYFGQQLPLLPDSCSYLK